MNLNDALKHLAAARPSRRLVRDPRFRRELLRRTAMAVQAQQLAEEAGDWDLAEDCRTYAKALRGLAPGC